MEIFKPSIKLSLLLLAAFLTTFPVSAQKTKATKNLKFGEDRWQYIVQTGNMEHNIKTDTGFAELYHYSRLRQYKNVEKRSRELSQKDWYNMGYYTYYLSALYNLGEEDLARKFALAKIKEHYKDGYGILSLLLFSDNPCFYQIGTDSIINNYALTVFINGYKENHYPKQQLGIQLIKLYFQDQLIRHLLDFRLLQCKNSKEAELVWNWFVKEDKEKEKKFLALYNAHPDYISKKEVGAISGFQQLLIWHLSSDITEKIFLPKLKNAMMAKEIPPESYIDIVTEKYLRSGNIHRAKALTDSLCKIYHCTAQYHFSKNS